MGDDLNGAVDVCLNQLKDLQLAIAITRVYESDSGPVLNKILQEAVLPLAAREGNRWMASWAFWMLGRKDMAVRALVVRIRSSARSSSLLTSPFSPQSTHSSRHRARPTSNLDCT